MWKARSCCGCETISNPAVLKFPTPDAIFVCAQMWLSARLQLIQIRPQRITLRTLTRLLIETDRKTTNCRNRTALRDGKLLTTPLFLHHFANPIVWLVEHQDHLTELRFINSPGGTFWGKPASFAFVFLVPVFVEFSNKHRVERDETIDGCSVVQKLLITIGSKRRLGDNTDGTSFFPRLDFRR